MQFIFVINSEYSVDYYFHFDRLIWLANFDEIWRQ